MTTRNPLIRHVLLVVPLLLLAACGSPLDERSARQAERELIHLAQGSPEVISLLAQAEAENVVFNWTFASVTEVEGLQAVILPAPAEGYLITTLIHLASRNVVDVTLSRHEQHQDDRTVIVRSSLTTGYAVTVVLDGDLVTSSASGPIADTRSLRAITTELDGTDEDELSLLCTPPQSLVTSLQSAQRSYAATIAGLGAATLALIWAEHALITCVAGPNPACGKAVLAVGIAAAGVAAAGLAVDAAARSVNAAQQALNEWTLANC